MSRHNQQTTETEIEQELANVKLYFDALNKEGKKRAKVSPHAMVDLPERLKDQFSDDPLLYMSTLLQKIQQDEDMPFIGVYYMEQEASTLINLEVTDCLSRLIDKEQGDRVIIGSTYNHLNQWIESVSPYFQQFEARREQGFKHEEVIRHYFPLDAWDQSFAIFQSIVALRDSIREAAWIDLNSESSTVVDMNPKGAHQQLQEMAVPPLAVVALTTVGARYAFKQFNEKIPALANKALSKVAAKVLDGIQFQNKIGQLYLEFSVEPEMAIGPFKIAVKGLAEKILLGSGDGGITCEAKLCEKINEFLNRSEEFHQIVIDLQKFLKDEVSSISSEFKQITSLITKYTKGEISEAEAVPLIAKHQEGIQVLHASMQTLAMFGGLVKSPTLSKVAEFGHHAIGLTAALSSAGIISTAALAPFAALGPYVAIAVGAINIASTVINLFKKKKKNVDPTMQAMQVLSKQLNHIAELIQGVAQNQAIIVNNQGKIFDYLTLISESLVAGFHGLHEYIGKEFQLTRYYNQRNHDEVMELLNRIHERLLDRTTVLYLGISEYKKAIDYVDHYPHYFLVPDEASQQQLKTNILSLMHFANQVVSESILTAADEIQGDNPFSHETIAADKIQGDNSFSHETINQVLTRANKIGNGWFLGYILGYYKDKINQGFDKVEVVCNVELWKQAVVAIGQGLFYLPAHQFPSEQAVDELSQCGKRVESFIDELQNDGMNVFNKLYISLLTDVDRLVQLFERFKGGHLQQIADEYKGKIQQAIGEMHGFLQQLSPQGGHREQFVHHTQHSINELQVQLQQPSITMEPLLASAPGVGRTLLKPFLNPVIDRIPLIFLLASYLRVGRFTGTVATELMAPPSFFPLKYIANLNYVDNDGGSHLLASVEYVMKKHASPIPLIIRKLPLHLILHFLNAQQQLPPVFPWNDAMFETKLTTLRFMVDPVGELVRITEGHVSRKINSLVAGSNKNTEQFDLIINRIEATLLLVKEFSEIMGVPEDYVQQVRQYIKRSPIEKICMKYLQDSIIAHLRNESPSYNLREKIKDVIEFIRDDITAFYFPDIPNNVTSETFSQMNMSYALPAFNSSLMTYIESGFANLGVTKMMRRIRNVQQHTNHKLSPVDEVLETVPTITRTITTTDQPADFSVGVAIGGVAVGLAVSTLMVLSCAKLAHRNWRIPLQVIALFGLAPLRNGDYMLELGDAQSIDEALSSNFEQESLYRRYLSHEPEHPGYQMDHAVIPYQPHNTNQSEADYPMHCQPFWQADDIPFLHCSAEDFQVWVFASDKHNPKLLDQSSQAIPMPIKFQVDRSTCRSVEFYNEPFMHCEGVSPDANYLVRLTDLSQPAFVEMCMYLPSTLQLLNFAVAVYQRYWGVESLAEVMDEDEDCVLPQDTAFATCTRVDLFRNQVEKMLADVTRLNISQMAVGFQQQKRNLSFVLQEYLYTMAQWNETESLPTVSELLGFEKDLVDIRRDFSLLTAELDNQSKAEDSSRSGMISQVVDLGFSLFSHRAGPIVDPNRVSLSVVNTTDAIASPQCGH